MNNPFIYFDLGNVLVRFNPERACQNLAQLAQATPAQVNEAVYLSGLQWQYEAGTLSCDDFADAVNHRLGSRLQGADLREALADMFYPDATCYPVIGRLLAQGIRVGLLSNTCAAHWQHLNRRRLEIVKMLSPIALSFELGFIKPDPRIYLAAAELAGVAPQTIFFTDDREENVVAATQAGWNAHLYQGAANLVRWLSAHGVSVFV